LVTVALGACGGETVREPAQPLVDAAWLNDNLESVVVLDVRYGAPGGADRQTYEAGHVPGAAFAGYRQFPWRVTRDGLPGMLPPVEALERLIGGLGVSNADHVVIVADGASAAEMGAATRVYWQFKVLGHDRVSILDGGYGAWQEAGYPVETGWREPAPKHFRGTYREELVADRDVVIAARQAGTPLVDARTESYYRGERKSGSVERYGTISGALNVPNEKLLQENGSFVEAAVATELWESAGIPRQGSQIAFCNSGHLASLAWFAAYEILGNREARLYDGSLAEWGADPTLPMDAPAAQPVAN
jgi:thiosulfate/3-mercaptopyruvate sulfurtransferase